MNPNAPESAKRPPFTDGDAAPSSPGDAFAAAAARLAEIKDYASYYLAAKLDSYKSSAKSLVLYAVLGLLAAVAGTAVLATAGVLTVRGIAEGLTLLFGYAWIADLVTGVVLLAAILGTAYFLVARILGKSRSATVKKYQDLQRQQLAKHGHNVHERATHANQH
jgi:hypothetical protein